MHRKAPATSRVGVGDKKEIRISDRDEELLEHLRLLDENLKISINELNDPKNSHRIFQQVVPGLINAGMSVSLETALKKTSDLFGSYISEPTLHPRFITTTGFVAAIQYFISLFEPERGKSLITVKDMFCADKNRVRMLLWTLSDIASITSIHEQELSRIHQIIMDEKDKRSYLWTLEQEINEHEKAQEDTEKNNFIACEQAQASLNQAQEKLFRMEEKYAETKTTASKMFEARETSDTALAKLKDRKQKLVDRLEQLQSEIVSDPEEITKSVEVAKAELQSADEEFNQKYLESMQHGNKNQEFVNVLEDSKKLHEKMLKAKKTDHADVLSLEKKLRILRTASRDLREDSNTYEVNRAKIAGRISLLQNNLTELKNQANVARLNCERREKEIDREIKTNATKLTDHRAENLHLREALVSLTARYEELRKQNLAVGREVLQYSDNFKKICEAAKDASEAEEAIVAEKLDAIKLYSERTMERQFGIPPATLGEVFPVSVRRTFRSIRDVKDKHELHGEFRRIPDNRDKPKHS